MVGDRTKAVREEDEDPASRLTSEEIEMLSRSGQGLSDFHRSKLERDSKKNWDLFYKRNGNRFFKNRYWTRHEFKELFGGLDNETGALHEQVSTRPNYLLEFGCGCGHFVLPLLDNDDNEQSSACDTFKTTNNLFIYCCDISTKAIEILKSNPIYQLNSPLRIKAFPADITAEQMSDIEKNLDGNLMDIISLVFVLSALDPNKMEVAIKNICQVIKPNGLVLFRDYAIYDKAMLRFSEKSKICDQFYVRQDGTRAYFFTKEQLVQLFERCSFKCQSIAYVRRETVNNSTRDKYSRIFLQAKFKKLLHTGS